MTRCILSVGDWGDARRSRVQGSRFSVHFRVHEFGAWCKVRFGVQRSVRNSAFHDPERNNEPNIRTLNPERPSVQSPHEEPLCACPLLRLKLSRARLDWCCRAHPGRRVDDSVRFERSDAAAIARMARRRRDCRLPRGNCLRDSCWPARATCRQRTTRGLVLSVGCSLLAAGCCLLQHSSLIQHSALSIQHCLACVDGPAPVTLIACARIVRCPRRP